AAAKQGNPSIIEKLLQEVRAHIDQRTKEFKAFIEKRTEKEGLTALDIAVAGGQADATGILLREGAAVDNTGKDGLRTIDRAFLSGNPEIAKAIWKKLNPGVGDDTAGGDTAEDNTVGGGTTGDDTAGDSTAGAPHPGAGDNTTLASHPGA